MTEKSLRMAVISGASHAIRFMHKNPRATEQEVLRYISDSVEEIIEKIDDSL